MWILNVPIATQLVCLNVNLIMPVTPKASLAAYPGRNYFAASVDCHRHQPHKATPAGHLPVVRTCIRYFTALLTAIQASITPASGQTHLPKQAVHLDSLCGDCPSPLDVPPTTTSMPTETRSNAYGVCPIPARRMPPPENETPAIHEAPSGQQPSPPDTPSVTGSSDGYTLEGVPTLQPVSAEMDMAIEFG